MHLSSIQRSSNAFALVSSVRKPAGKTNGDLGLADWQSDPTASVTNAAIRHFSYTRHNAPNDGSAVQLLRKQVAALRALKDGWDGGSSVSPDPSILASATAYLEFALGGSQHAPLPTIIPVADGSVQAEWYSQEYRFEMYFESDGEIAAWRENRITGVEFDAEGSDAVQLLIDWLASHDENVLMAA